MLKQGLRLLKQAFGANVQAVPNFAKILNDMGNLYKDAGRFPEAEAALSRALAIGRARSGEDHTNVAASMGNLAVPSIWAPFVLAGEGGLGARCVTR